MPIGIDPKVDYAFKLVFGNPKHTAVTIHFLNAVLDFPEPITAVTILNPIRDREHAEDKLAILDILAADGQGRRYNVEMQTTLPADLAKRLTYYNCLNFVEQLKAGETYDRLRPAISICVLNRVMYATAPEYHLSFRLRCDQQPQLTLNDDLTYHLLELPKFDPTDNNVRRGPLEKWLYFLKNAAQLEAEELAERLTDDEFREAAGVLKMISETPEEREFYESRRKVYHDVNYWIATAHAEGKEEGHAEGKEEGHAEGKEEGRKEGAVDKIQLLQELCGEEVGSTADLMAKEPDELDKLFADLQQRLRSRGD